MNGNQPVLECIPNFSEGRDMAKITAIEEAIRSVEGCHLLHTDISPAANRTVMTFAGQPDAVVEAAFRAIKTAASLIDMAAQAGVHPRIGATDVCPLVPLYHMDMEAAIACSRILGERAGTEIGIPVYLYEHSASQSHRRALPDIRKGQYEGLAAKMRLPEWKPDYGPSEFNPATGATVIGARDILVAFNIALDTKDVSRALYIAERLRESGYLNLEDGRRTRIKGQLPKVRAIGWYMADYDCAQVSFNILDYRVTSPYKAWLACKGLASELGISLLGSEVIGLIPEACLLEAGKDYYAGQGSSVPEDPAVLIDAAIDCLGLSRLKHFSPEEKVLEYRLRSKGLLTDK